MGRILGRKTSEGGRIYFSGRRAWEEVPKGKLRCERLFHGTEIGRRKVGIQRPQTGRGWGEERKNSEPPPTLKAKGISGGKRGYYVGGDRVRGWEGERLKFRTRKDYVSKGSIMSGTVMYCGSGVSKRRSEGTSRKNLRA